MIRRLALLCPDPSEPAYTTRIPAPVHGYHDLFARLGVEVVAHPWVDPVPADVDGVLATLAWGYHFRPAHWDRILATWDPSVPLVNPPEVLRWNTTKTYLQGLGDAGVSVIPTRTPPLSSAAELEAAFDTFGTDELVIKPLVSAGSHETVRFRRGDPVPAPAAGRMIQPFLPTVSSEGELSMFYFAGRFSHAVRKRATGTDFRVQPQYGGQLETFAPDAEATGLAEAVLAAAPAGIVYARIDLIRRLDGRLALMELEAIEPDLYFEFAPDGGRGFGEAVLAHLEAGSPR
jgi:hypothetical protein